MNVIVLDGDVKRGSVMMGQTAGIIDSVKPLKDVLADLINDAINERNKLVAKMNMYEGF